MESKEIFAMALNLSEPWYIENVVMSIDKQTHRGQVDIYINFKQGSKFKDTMDEDCPVYDTIQKTWQHINFFEHRCFIHARVPRISKKDKRVELVQVPWARSGSGFTLMFEAFGMLMIESEMPVKKAAEIIRIHDTRLWRIFKYWIRKAFSREKYEGVKNVGIDETSVRKGHDYISIAVDMDKRKVIFAHRGKDKGVLKALRQHLEVNNCPKEQIQHISMDMSPAFISGSMENFPSAQITFDKFHLMKYINEAMDEVRQSERKQHNELNGYKYIFLKNDSKMTKKEMDARHYFLGLYEELAKAFRLKELFNDIWEFSSPDEAGGYLSYWCDLAEESKLQPFRKVISMVKSHWSGIVNYFRSKLNNGILEGINTKIQLAKKRARGYRNIDNFIYMIYFISGKLKFDYPLYLA